MSRWCRGGALIAAWLGLSLAARAQYLPSPVGAARMPEPVPCGPSGCQGPDLVPGPISPQAAPPGPPDCLSLPANHSSAFQCEEYCGESALYGSIGTQALQRQKLGKGGTAVLDPLGIPTGFGPPSGTPVVQRFNDLTPDMDFGIRGTVGYLCGNEAMEATGYYIFRKDKAIDTINPAHVDTFFFNPPPGFQGITGNNGLFLQANRIRTEFGTRLLNSELNYRLWNAGVNGLELIAGVRYVDYKEELSIATDHSSTITGIPDPTMQAIYQSGTRNHIIAGQLGVEYNTNIFSWLGAGFFGKAALGGNIININNTLDRADGLNAFNYHHNSSVFSQVYEAGAFLDFCLLERARVRAGYEALWLVDIATAQDQVDFNLANPAGRQDIHGSAFFHGPLVELQLLF